MFKVRTKARRGAEKMISYDQIVSQIEKQLQKAKMGSNEQMKREALSAIGALCAVALDTEVSIPTTMASPTAIPVSMQSTPLQDSGANGDSLFDF